MVVKMEEVTAKVEKGEELSAEDKQAVMEFGDDGAPPVEGEGEAAADGAPAAKAAEPAKKEPEPAAKKPDEAKAPDPTTDPDFKAKLDTELEKPPGNENLKDFTAREKAYFYEMRTTRRRMHAAETKTKEVEFELLQKKLTEKKEREAEGDGKKKAPDTSVDDFFTDKEDDDVVTVAEVKKALAASSAKGKPQGFNEGTKKYLQNLTFQLGMLQLKSEGVSDAEEVLRYTDELLDPDVDKSDYAKAAVEAVTEAHVSGTPGSYVKVIYNLIKGHPRWDEIESKLSAKKAAPTGKTPEKNPIEEEKRLRAKRLEDNQEKARGNGGAGGGGDNPDGELTDEELSQINMEDWGKLKSGVRERALKRL